MFEISSFVNLNKFKLSSLLFKTFNSSSPKFELGSNLNSFIFCKTLSNFSFSNSIGSLKENFPFKLIEISFAVSNITFLKYSFKSNSFSKSIESNFILKTSNFFIFFEHIIVLSIKSLIKQYVKLK